MTKRSIASLLIGIILLVATGLIIIFARGYRINPKQGKLSATGLLVATSFPDGASVFVDGKLITATNNTINLNPGEYTVKITKEGYIPWEKRLKFQGEIVTKTDAQLFPSAPELRPLTTLGVLNPTLSSNGSKIAYAISSSDNFSTISKDGLWILNLSDRPLGFTPQSVQITKSTPQIDWSKSIIYWSPDSKEILAIFQTPADPKNPKSKASIRAAYLLSSDQLNTIPKDITSTLATTLKSWGQDKELKEQSLLAGLPEELQKIAGTSAIALQLSPDENKLLYTATGTATLPQIITPPLIGSNSQSEQRIIKPGNTYIYDIKEDKNFQVYEGIPTPSQKPTPTPKSKATPPPSSTPATTESLLISLDSSKHLDLSWFATSRHIVFIQNKTIYVMEYDGTNKQAIYGGPFEDSYLFPYPNGSKLIILTSYNKALGDTPNLYTINLK